jgi:opacity protein-like surface antigen
MASFKALCLAGVASLAATASAYAADLPMPLPPPPPVYQPAPALGGNWYLRGDVGVGIADLRTQQSSFSPLNVPPAAQFENSSLDDAAFVDGGVGYRFNQYFRVDVTGEYRAAAQYSAIETYNQGAFFTPPTGQRNADAYHGNVRVVDGLVNGYVDLGTYYGITPFGGVGVGVANIQAGPVIDNGEGGGLGYSSSASTTNFAYAFMAGLDFQVTRNLVMELGYRYLNAGSFSSGAIVCQNESPCPNEVQHHKLAYNDIRLGFRYILPDIGPVGPSPILVTKY